MVDTPTKEEPAQGTDTPGPEDVPAAEATPEEPKAATDAAPDEAPEDAPADEEEPSDELDDETLEALAEAYDDRLRKTKTLSRSVTQQVKDEVGRQVREHQSVASTQTRADQFVNQGRSAAENIQRLANAARGELDKAGGDEPVNASVLDPKEMVASLEQYGSATAMYERHVLETATQDGFDHVFGEVLPELSDEHVEELQGITTTINRMRGDQQQYTRADSTWMTQLLDFVARRAMEHGAAEERSRLASRSAVKGKIADTNAVAAARAKIEAGKTPPRTPKSEPQSVVTDFSEDGYRTIKKDGTPEQIQDYVNRWATARTSGGRA
jgi:hypothetical protein